MDEQEYEDLKRYITTIRGEEELPRPVGRPKGCKDKKKRKARIAYPQGYQVFGDDAL